MSKTEKFSNSLNETRLKFVQAHVWKHYKGGIYKITNFSIDTDTLEVRVEYKRIDGPDFDANAEHSIFFSRPLSQWFDDVDGQPRFVQVEQIARWEPVAL